MDKDKLTKFAFEIQAADLVLASYGIKYGGAIAVWRKYGRTKYAHSLAGNTYAIKGTLKELGWKWNKLERAWVKPLTDTEPTISLARRLSEIAVANLKE